MDRFLSKHPDIGLFVLRVGVGAMMLTHGYPKLMTLLNGGEIQFADPIGIGVTASFVLVVLAEFLCSIFLIVGFKARFAAIPLAITMFVAGFMVHGADPWERKEKAILYLLVYVVLILAGGGKPALKK